MNIPKNVIFTITIINIRVGVVLLSANFSLTNADFLMTNKHDSE